MRGSLRPVGPAPFGELAMTGRDRNHDSFPPPAAELSDPNREPPQAIAGGGAAASLAKGSNNYLSRCVCPEFAK